MFLPFTPAGVEFAYRHGAFPMYNNWTEEIDWYSPDPRTIIPLESFHISRSLQKTMRQGGFEVRVNTDFEGVMRGCAVREEGTWISEEFIEIYGALHRQGKAHSVEVFVNDRLVGGTYGVALGSAFMAESMFHYETDASKVALAALVARLKSRDFTLLDVQYMTPHLARFGAMEISLRDYNDQLRRALRRAARFE